MIVEMKKVSLVMLKAEQEQALKKLRSLGVLHLESLEGNGEKLAELKAALEQCNDAVGILSEIKLPKGTSCKDLTSEELENLSAAVLSDSEKKKSLQDLINLDKQELDRFKAWGSVTVSDFSYLAENGIYLSLYEIPQDKWRNIGDDVNVLLVNKDKNQVRFLLLSDSADAERPAGLPAEAYSVPMPKMSTKELAEEIEASERQIADLDSEISSKAVYVPALKNYSRKLIKEIEFETVNSGMGHEGDGSSALSWITGFVPVDSLDRLKQNAISENWAFAVSDPSEEDNVPTKLKNNKLVSLIYPLTDFLGTVPGYHEFDISGWFLLFFTIFFGMIFGDGGYGLLLTFAALLGMAISFIKGKKPGAGLGLLLLLGLSTVAWGTVTCTWFGLPLEKIPDWVKNLSLKPLSNAFIADFEGRDGVTTVTQNLQIFCFSLALLQLTVAHIKAIAKNIKSLKAFGDFGSLILLWGMFYVVLSMVVDAKIFSFDKVVYGIPIGTVAIVLVAAGFMLSFVFANYEGSIVSSILESVKNIISVLLGVVNVFSDIVSYIRLWAVGLAGAAISNTVNQMAGPMWGKLSLLLTFVILLVFGHGLNMILNVLSVIVHGVRLNTLEFSSHLGMSWSGFKYEPFSETVNK